jgi:hypothetical protein
MLPRHLDEQRSMGKVRLNTRKLPAFSASRRLSAEYQADIRRLDESRQWMKYPGKPCDLASRPVIEVVSL